MLKISKLQDLQKRMNALESKKQTIKTRQSNFSKLERKKRTRTLIQAGALLKMLGYFEFCDICEGDDLEMDIESKNKTATLIGMLETFKTSLPHFLSIDEKEHFKNIGIHVLKMKGKS